MEYNSLHVKKTDDLLKILSTDLKSFKPLTASKLRLLGMGVLVFTSAAFLLLLPLRENLTQSFGDLRFWLNTLGWLIMATLSLNSFVKISATDKSPKIEVLAISSLFAIMMFGYLFNFDSTQLKQQFILELDWYVGRCGPIILITSTLCSLGFAYLTKTKLAPFEPLKTAFWIGLTSGTCSTFLMQFVCAHENFLHVLIWHVFPLSIFCGLSAFLGQKFYRW